MEPHFRASASMQCSLKAQQILSPWKSGYRIAGLAQTLYDPTDPPGFSVLAPMAVETSPLIQVSLSLMIACGGSVGLMVDMPGTRFTAVPMAMNSINEPRS
jgi:hypothetical protein